MDIKDIKIGERFRKDYSDVDKLAESIEKFGLIHPIVVDDANNLIAGGRRLQACVSLGWSDIPATRLSCLSDTERRIVELEENIQRKDLLWHEEAALRTEIHKLLVEKAGDKWEPGVRTNIWSIEKTAAILGIKKTAMLASLNAGVAIAQIPQLKTCNSQSEALKTINNYAAMSDVQMLLEQEEVEEQTAIENKTEVKINPHKRLFDSFIVGDAIEGMLKLTNKGFYTFAEVDPPYATELPRLRGLSEHALYEEITNKEYPSFIAETARALDLVLAPNAWIAWWFSGEHSHMILSILRSFWKVDSVSCVWNKTVYIDGRETVAQCATPNPTFMLPRAYEQFYLCRKGSPVLTTNIQQSTVFNVPKLWAHDKIHLAQRPRLLIDKMIDAFYPGIGKIISPFLGSGETLLASYIRGIDCIGWDIMPEAYLKFVDRIKKELTDE